MADIQAKYGTDEQPITISLVSTADAAARESDLVSNASNLFLDVMVGGKITTGTSPTNNSTIVFYTYGTVDGGTLNSGGATGASGIFAGQESNLFYLGSVVVSNSSDITYECGPWSVAQSFGGPMPSGWGIVVKNNTGSALNSSASNHDINYHGIYAQTV